MTVYGQVGRTKTLTMYLPLYKTPLLIVTVWNSFGDNLSERYSFDTILDTVLAKQVPTMTWRFMSTQFCYSTIAKITKRC